MGGGLGGGGLGGDGGGGLGGSGGGGGEAIDAYVVRTLLMHSPAHWMLVAGVAVLVEQVTIESALLA